MPIRFLSVPLEAFLSSSFIQLSVKTVTSQPLIITLREVLFFMCDSVPFNFMSSLGYILIWVLCMCLCCAGLKKSSLLFMKRTLGCPRSPEPSFNLKNFHNSPTLTLQQEQRAGTYFCAEWKISPIKRQTTMLPLWQRNQRHLSDKWTCQLDGFVERSLLW